MKRAKARKESFVKTEDMQIQEQFSGMPKRHTTLSPSLENDQECLKEAAFEDLYCRRLSQTQPFFNRKFANLIRLDTFTFYYGFQLAEFSKLWKSLKELKHVQ